MMDENLALLRAHRNNISRYHRLLKTELTEFERHFIERRLAEERSALENIAASTFPLSFQAQVGTIRNATPPPVAYSQGQSNARRIPDFRSVLEEMRPKGVALASMHDGRAPRHGRIGKRSTRSQICCRKSTVSDASVRALSPGEPSNRHGAIVIGELTTKTAASAADARMTG
ncbi:hypothetical protein [Bradyrhizobium commune]|uniref:hypothetical protein n=1 Tax=Bradyrhizobium commune TaxID=83627 RepID=UPI001FED8B61|nr:hypothetical protein [Bradyrhizobium commune]